PSTLVDAIIAELPNKKIKMPANYKSCAKGPAKEFMYRYIELLAGAGAHFNALRLKRVAGLLTSELLANFDAVSNDLQYPVFYHTLSGLQLRNRTLPRSAQDLLYARCQHCRPLSHLRSSR
ncbi:hypothetical protein PENTCL1PPCAC_9524, partial [Pristionchus entomophagus]